MPSVRRSWRLTDFATQFQASQFGCKRPWCPKCRRTMRLDPGWSWCGRCKRGRAEPIGFLEGAGNLAYRKSDIMKELWQTLDKSDAPWHYRNSWLSKPGIVIVNDLDERPKR